MAKDSARGRRLPLVRRPDKGDFTVVVLSCVYELQPDNLYTILGSILIGVGVLLVGLVDIAYQEQTMLL